MKTEELKALQELMETWEKRRKHLGEYNADCKDILILGQTLLAVIKGMQEPVDSFFGHPLLTQKAEEKGE